jgi:hypothetical protein
MTGDSATQPGREFVVLGRQAIEDMVGKVAHTADQPHTAQELAAWKAAHGTERIDANRSYAVVGETLMYLHTCSDGVVVPVALYPDGRTKVYCDHEHVGELASTA